MSKNLFKSIGAVLAGFVTVVVLSVATDAALQAIGFFPPMSGVAYPDRLLAVALAYRCAYTVLGGYVTAWLAPERPMRLVKILAGIGLVAGTLGVIGGWSLSAHWYPIAIAAGAVPLTWLGGWLRQRMVGRETKA